MAYAYDKLYQAMGQPQQQANIFAPDQGQQGASPDGQAPGRSMGRVQSSSTEGAITPMRSASGEAPQGSYSAPAPGPVSGSAAIKANSAPGKATSSPIDLGRLSTTIGDAKAKVQGEADSYLTNQAAKPFGGTSGPKLSEKNPISGDDWQAIDRWAEGAPIGDESGFGMPDGDPSWKTLFEQGPGQTQAFDATTNTDFRDAQDLATDAGIQNVLRRRGGAEYSAGEAAFDSGLLRNDAGFQQGRQRVLEANRDLGKTVSDLESGSLQQQATKQRDNNYTSWKDAVTRRLDTIAGANRRKALDREAAFDAGLAVPENYAQGTADETLKRLKENEQYKDLAPYLNLDGIDASSFLTPGMTADQTSANQFFAPQDAYYYNRVMDLLGRGGERAVGDDVGSLYDVDVATKRGGFNKDSLTNTVIANAGTAKQKAEEKAKAEGAAAKAAAEAAKTPYQVGPPSGDRPATQPNPWPAINPRDPQLPLPGPVIIDPRTGKPTMKPFIPKKPEDLGLPFMPGPMNPNFDYGAYDPFEFAAEGDPYGYPQVMQQIQQSQPVKQAGAAGKNISDVAKGKKKIW